MPALTYNGRYWTAKAPGGLGEMTRGMTLEVSNEWCDEYASRVTDEFILTGYETHADEGNDGIPDPSWRVADIKVWLKESGVTIGNGYKTKSALLAMVEEQLNPTPVEAVAEQTTME